MDQIKKIIKAYLEKKGIIYERTLGAEEITLFMMRAPEKEQEKFMNLLNEQKVEEAMKIVENFLNNQLEGL